MNRFNTTIPLSLYIHIPWCVRKCPYCDFNSHTAEKVLPEEAYIERLLTDLEQQLPRIWGRRIVSIFLEVGLLAYFHLRELKKFSWECISA